VSQDARRPDVAESSKVGELRIQVGRLKTRFLEVYDKCSQFVTDAGSKRGLKSVQYECHMKLCLKGRAEDGTTSLNCLGDVAAGLGIDREDLVGDRDREVLPLVRARDGPGKERKKSSSACICAVVGRRDDSEISNLDANYYHSIP